MSGRIITVAQQKGGAGKTTVAAHLAVALARQGRHVAALDIDPQGSLAAWFRVRESSGRGGLATLNCAALAGWRAKAELDRLVRAHEAVVVDSPPHAQTEARIVIRAADLVVVPVQPSPLDLWATAETLAAARDERIPAAILLNRVPARASLNEQVEAAAREFEVPLLDGRLGQRVHFAAAMAEGLTAQEAAPRSRAAAEIGDLALEIARRLGLDD